MEDTPGEDRRGARTEFQESLTSESQSPLRKYMAIAVGEGYVYVTGYSERDTDDYATIRITC